MYSKDMLESENERCQNDAFLFSSVYFMKLILSYIQTQISAPFLNNSENREAIS
jgi:hypothetical protein